MHASSKMGAVVEKDLHSLPYSNVTALEGTATSVDPAKKTVFLSCGGSLAYDKLCICTGALPQKVIEDPLVLVLRDQDTLTQLLGRLGTAKRVVLIGNGGIALELAYSLSGIELVWVIKHSYIGSAFFDADAAAFLKGELGRSKLVSHHSDSIEQQDNRQHGSQLAFESQHAPVSISMSKGRPSSSFGHAVGPQWAGTLPDNGQAALLKLESDCTVLRVREGTEGWPLAVDLSNGKSIQADFLISAVGVVPNTEWLEGTLDLHPEDKGILVNRQMQSSALDIYAAGDACCIAWPDLSRHWFQMRLWTQAKTMGTYAAHCMASTPEADAVSFSFEMFTHVTRFLGMKVVLLGLYNGQGIPESEAGNMVSYSRCVEGAKGHFVRVLLHNHRMVGAVLIGETELEDTFENLILDELNLSSYGEAILDPRIEFDQVFD